MTSKCIGCAAESSEPLLTSAVKGKPSVRLRHCTACSLVFLESWTDEFQSELYDYYVRSAEKSKEELYDPITESRYRQLELGLRSAAPGRSMLDVGCGRGHWVDFMVRAGWNVRGIDLAKPAVELCQRFGLPVTETNLFDPSLQPASFDLITMFEVIEHVPAPRAFLVRAAELLAPGGALYLTTPNFDCVDRRVLGGGWSVIYPEHLSYFTPATLGSALQASGGLELVQLNTRNTGLVAAAAAMGRRRQAPEAVPQGASKQARSLPRSPQQRLRHRIEGSLILRTFKDQLNVALDASRLGSDMTALCRRTP